MSHHPPHIYLDDTWYIVTASTLNHIRFFAQLHGGTAWQINTWAGVRGRQIWHNYWDTCIRNEKGYWTRFNYIHQNPVKHGYVQDTIDWPFSSYHYYLRTKGQEWLHDCLATYPVLDYLEGDDF
jgi:putative transposase